MEGLRESKERVCTYSRLVIVLVLGFGLGCGWAERVVKILLDERKENCPAFCDGEGYQLTERKVEEVIASIRCCKRCKETQV